MLRDLHLVIDLFDERNALFRVVVALRAYRRRRSKMISLLSVPYEALQCMTLILLICCRLHLKLWLLMFSCFVIIVGLDRNLASSQSFNQSKLIFFVSSAHYCLSWPYVVVERVCLTTCTKVCLRAAGVCHDAIS